MNKFKMFLVGLLSLIPIAVFIAGIFLKENWMLITGLVVFALYGIVLVLQYLRQASIKNENIEEETVKEKRVRFNAFNPIKSWNSLSRPERNTFLSILFVALCGYSLVIIFMCFNELIYSLIAFCSFIILIVAVIIISSIITRIATSGKYTNFDEPAIVGKIISCKIYTQKNNKASDKKDLKDKKSIVYKVKIDVDGEIKTACSNTLYQKGVQVFVRKNKQFKNFVTIEE